MQKYWLSAMKNEKMGVGLKKPYQLSSKKATVCPRQLHAAHK